MRICNKSGRELTGGDFFFYFSWKTWYGATAVFQIWKYKYIDVEDWFIKQQMEHECNRKKKKHDFLLCSQKVSYKLRD